MPLQALIQTCAKHIQARITHEQRQINDPKFITGSNEVVRIAVAENSNTEPFTLAKLVPLHIHTAFDLDLIAALARNGNTPEYALSRLGALIAEYPEGRLVEDKRFLLCVAMCCNPNTRLDVIEMLLAQDRSTIELRKLVALKTWRRDVLHLLCNDRSKTVREQARATSNCRVNEDLRDKEGHEDR